MIFKKKKDSFFECFELIVDNIHSASQVFRKELDNLGDAEKFALQIKDLEHKGDQFTHAVIRALNNTFITPIDREDILGLTIKLDDILDLIEACAWNFDLYGITKVDNFMKLFAKNIEECTQEVCYAIQYLVVKKLKDMTRHTYRINDLENEADDLFRESIKVLFSTCTDPVEIIKRKEMYFVMEQVSDACEDVADILEGIIMRHS